MPDNDFTAEITNVYVGRERLVQRVFDEYTAEQVLSAYLVCKATKLTGDPELCSLAITTTPSYSGVITDDGQTDAAVTLTFVLSPGQTALFDQLEAVFYEMGVVTANHSYPAERGVIFPKTPLSAFH